MKTFTIDTDNNISAFATPAEAAATTTTPFDTFASEKELASLIAKWPADRLVAIWNSLPGVTPVKKFKNANPHQPHKPLVKSEYQDTLTMADVFRIVSLNLDENSCVVSDVGDAIFGAVGIRTADQLGQTH